jgi:hypothetical protein
MALIVTLHKCSAGMCLHTQGRLELAQSLLSSILAYVFGNSMSMHLLSCLRLFKYTRERGRHHGKFSNIKN